MNACMNECTYVRTYAYIYICVSLFAYIYIHRHMHLYVCMYIHVFMSCKTPPSCTVCNVTIICWTLKNIKIKPMLFDTLPFGMVSFRHSDLLSSRCVWVELIWLFWCLMVPVFICFHNLKPDINDRFMFPVADRCWKVYRPKRRKWRTAGQLFGLGMH